ncbi:MAG TPA: ABC transporter permease [Labilithrix sp.]|nr:ABC transporter permease [Labilithrix sp.]
MNLAFHDIRHHVGRFVATSAVVGLLFTVVLAMAGIYQGLVDDATVLLVRMDADLWIVQRGTRGPFADPSRLDPSLEARVAAVPGVLSARAFTTQVLQRDHGTRQLRFALVGLSFPEERGEGLAITQGRPLAQAHGEIVADASLGVAIGEIVRLGRDDYRVVGLTRQLLASGGDAVVFATIADAQRVLADDSSDALIAERERRLARLRNTDLGRGQPALEDLAVDPRWTFPAIAAPPIQAVRVRVAPARADEVRAALGRWSDVSVWTHAEEEQLVLQGMVEKARMQLGVFAAILIVSSSLLLAAMLYNLTLEKAHDIAVLRLLGARASRLIGLVLQQSWATAVLGYAIALAIGSQAFPHFPRRVVLTEASIVGVGLLLLVVSTLASVAGVVYALRVDPGPVLEG